MSAINSHQPDENVNAQDHQSHEQSLHGADCTHLGQAGNLGNFARSESGFWDSGFVCRRTNHV